MHIPKRLRDFTCGAELILIEKRLACWPNDSGEHGNKVLVCPVNALMPKQGLHAIKNEQIASSRFLVGSEEFTAVTCRKKSLNSSRLDNAALFSLLSARRPFQDAIKGRDGARLKVDRHLICVERFTTGINGLAVFQGTLLTLSKTKGRIER